MRHFRIIAGLVVAAGFSIAGCAGASLASKTPEQSGATAGSDQSKSNPRAGDPTSGHAGLQWMHDRFNAALSAAATQRRPLVIDMWANWCHTCLSMKHFVLKDAQITAYADQFIWLSLDTDKEVNAAALERFPVSAWPTFFIVDPREQSVLTRYQGAASAEQFAAFLEQGQRMFATTAPEASRTDLLSLVQRADQAALEEDWTEARNLYRQALGQAEPDWPRRPDLLVSLIGVLARSNQWSECIDLGLDHMDDTGSSASAADFAYYATSCIRSLDKGDARGGLLLEKTAARLDALTSDDRAGLSVDDRSDALRILRDVQITQDSDQAAARTAQKQLELLDRAAADAPSPQAAATYNWPRAEVYVFLNRGQELLDALEASARALPNDFDPPYRIAWVALKTGDLDRALAAAKKACVLVYGPRKGSALNLLAEIQKARGDKKGELDARKQAVEHYESLPPGQFSQEKLDRARQLLEALEKQN